MHVLLLYKKKHFYLYLNNHLFYVQPLLKSKYVFLSDFMFSKLFIFNFLYKFGLYYKKKK